MDLTGPIIGLVLVDRGEGYPRLPALQLSPSATQQYHHRLELEILMLFVITMFDYQ